MIALHESHLDIESRGGCRDDTRRRQSESLDDGSGKSTSTKKVVIIESGGGGEGSKVILLRSEKDCRICHLSLDVNSLESGNGIPIELGCCCKDDLAVAHKQCAETWFKIKGNRTCEICGSTARNIVGTDEASELSDQCDEPNGSTPSQATAPGESMAASETHNFWQGHRFLNFLLAAMVFAFVISWLFHFNVPS